MTNRFGVMNTFKAALGMAIALPLAVSAAPTLKVATSPTNYLTVALTSTTSGGVTTYSTTMDTSHCSSCSTTSLMAEAGKLTWSGTVGDFTIENAVGMTKPALAQPALDLGIANVGTGAVGGTLTLTWSDTDFVSGTPVAHLNVQTAYVVPGTVAYTAYVDNTNALFGTGTLAGSIPASSGGNVLISGSGPSSTGTFSMTEVETFVMGPYGAALTDDGFTVSLAGVTWACPAATASLGTAYTSSSPTTGIPPYNASITTGSLPPGITLSSNGIFSGTPTTPGTYPFTATVTDSQGQMSGSATISCTITVPNPLVSSCAVISALQNTAITPVQLTASGGSGSYTFSSTDLPAGLTISASGKISGIPTGSGSFTYHVTVTDNVTHQASISPGCTITVYAPVMSSCSVISAVQNTAITPVQLTASGGSGSYTFSSADLPAGLSMSPSGLISGTVSSTGTFTYHVTVTDTNTQQTSTSSGCSVTVNSTLSISCPTMNTVQLGNSLTLAPPTVKGGVPGYTFSLAAGSTLPPGLNLNPHTGEIVGSPKAYGSFFLQVQDASGTTALGSCPYTVSAVPTTCTFPYPTGTAPALSSVIFNESTVLEAFTAPAAGSGNQIKVWFSDEHAPVLGVRQVSVITASGTTTTDYSSLFTAYNASTMSAVSPNSPLPVGATGLTGIQAGTDTALQTAAYNYGSGYNSNGRPLWPSLFITDITNTSTSMSGDWQQGGTSAIPPNAVYGTWKGAVKTVDQTKSPAVITVTTDADPAANGTAGIPDTPPSGFGANLGYTTEAVWNVSTLGLIPGHTYRMQVIVHDGDQNKSGGDVGEACVTGVTMPIVPLTLSSVTGTGNVGSPYNSSLVGSGGSGSYTYSIVGTLPPGLTFNAATGLISGTPTTTGSYSFTSKVTDSSNNVVSNNSVIVIGARLPLSVSCSTVTVGQVDSPFTSPAPVVTGGTAPYSFSVVGSLPTGLILNADGSISGTPKTVGTFSLKVTDSTGTATTTCSYTITACFLTKLGAAGQFSVLGLAGATVNLQSALGGAGTVGVGENGTLHIMGRSAVASSIYADTSAAINIDKDASLTGVTTTEGFAGIDSSALVASTAFAALTPTRTLSGPAISATTTITGNGGQNVIALNTQINLNNGQNLVFTGGQNDIFIVNVAQGQNFQLQNGSSIVLNGVSPSQVLFNFVGTGANLTTKSGPGGISNTAGIFLNPNGNISIQGGTHNSEFISGGTIQMSSSPQSTPTMNPLTCTGPSSLSLSCASPSAPLGSPYNSALTASGGAGPYTYSLASGSLPPGLTLNTSTGAITGTPTTVGGYSFTAKVVDSAQFSATSSCSISVMALPLTLSCPGSSGTVGGPYSSSIAATGGVPPYTYSVTPSLPAGLKLTSSTGAIIGILGASQGPFTFTAQVMDASGASGGTATTSCTVTPGAPVFTLKKTASPTNPTPFQLVTYTYTVKNTSLTTLTNIVVTDDGGTPNDPSDNYTVGTIASLAPGASQTLTWVTYPSYQTTIVDAAKGVIPGGTLTIQNIAAGLKVTLTQALTLNDNSYGTNISPAWVAAGKTHKFQDLTGSDMAEFQFFDSKGTLVLDFAVDYISAATTPAAACPNANWASYPSGYGTLGNCGGDGKSITGTASYVVSANTTLTDNLNQSSAFYGYTTNSPAQGFPGWNFVDGYSVIVNPAAFGANGFGSVAIPVIHNSPSINGTDKLAHTVASSCSTNTATAIADSGQSAAAQATVLITAAGKTPVCQ